MATKGNVLADESNTTDTLKYVEGTFTPTVTLVGGSGNTVPVYTTNSGRYTRIGNRVFVEVMLDGDGGAEGAGTGALNVALPVAASASIAIGYTPIGHGYNGATEMVLLGVISGGASVISLAYFNTISTIATLTGAGQNSTTRRLSLKFSYEV